MYPSFKEGFGLLFVLGILTPVTKSTPHGGPPWKLPSLTLPQKEAMILNFFGIHLGELPIRIFPLHE